jgi:hypothetical protein
MGSPVPPPVASGLAVCDELDGKGTEGGAIGAESGTEGAESETNAAPKMTADSATTGMIQLTPNRRTL